MNKLQRLSRLQNLMEKDSSLPLLQANLVFGEGNPNATALFIGEAPGKNEDEALRPFVGAAGKLLDKMIASIRWKRDDVYITNIVKRRPPLNRDPLPAEIAAYTPYLDRQIAIIEPKVIVTLGRFAMNHFLPDMRISEGHGKLFLCKDRAIFPIYHPAAARRSRAMMEVFEGDFKKLPAVIKKIARQPSCR